MEVFFFLLICFTSTICIETIHRLDTFLIRTFVPLLLTANTDQPHTLCLCNNNARIILIIRIIITLITVVINILFIHKSWQQIRHGDAHDSRTQNSKAVQKREFVFTLRLSVYLLFCPLDGCTKGFFCLMHLISTTYCSICCFDTDLRLFSWRHCYTTPTFLHLFEQRAISRSFVCFQIDMPWFVNDWLNIKFINTLDVGLLNSRFFRQTLATLCLTLLIQLDYYTYSCTFPVAWLSSGLINDEISNRSIPFTPHIILTPNMYTDKY